MIDKGLYAAPEGLESLDIGDGEMELEIIIETGELEDEDNPIEEFKEDDFDENLAEVLDESVIQTVVSDLIADYEDDLNSRKDWMETYVDGLELLGMKLEERADPWIGACGVYHPLLAEALVKFQAEVMMSTFPAAGPVKTQIIGKETPEKKDAAKRVAADMNYQLTDRMTEFRPEHERMLWGLGLSGNAFKKVYFDPSKGRQTSIFVQAEDIVVPYGASNIETADRVTHVMRKTENELRKLQVDGFYIDEDLGTPDNNLDEVEKKIAEKMGFKATTDDRYKILEMNVNLDLPGFEHKNKKGEMTGIRLPYIVTVEKGTSTCLAIRRNWRPEDELFTARQHYVHYGYVPGFGFYCLGLIHLVGAFAKSGTSILRQLVDAGTLSNLPGGFKTRGLRSKGDDTPVGPGEWRDVDVPSGALKDNIMALPYKEPSQVLAGLLDKIVEEGRRFASAADIQVADMSANSPVGTTLAILERQLKVMTAVQARIHYAFKQELVLLRDIIRDYTPDEYTYEPDEGNRGAKKSDYDMVEVIPVSDPNAATMAQKIVQYQAVIQLSQQAPQIYDLPQLHRQMLDVLGIKNADKLVPLEDDEKPKDPISENMNALKGKPMKAFIYQDHDAHITVHQTFMQDPNVMATIGQNPQANQIMASLQGHIAEHLGFHYRNEIEKHMGVTMPEPDKEMPPEIEAELSKLIAQAAKQLLQENKQEAAQKKSEEMAKDPLIQMQQKELEIKQQDVQIKSQKAQSDAQAKQAQLANEATKIANQKEVEDAKLAADLQKLSQEQNHARYLEDAKHRMDIMKTTATHSHTRNMEEKKMKMDALKTAAQIAAQKNKGNK